MNEKQSIQRNIEDDLTILINSITRVVELGIESWLVFSQRGILLIVFLVTRDFSHRDYKCSFYKKGLNETTMLLGSQFG